MKRKPVEEKKQKINITVDPVVLKNIDRLAQIYGRSRSNMMEYLIKQNIDYEIHVPKKNHVLSQSP